MCQFLPILKGILESAHAQKAAKFHVRWMVSNSGDQAIIVILKQYTNDAIEVYSRSSSRVTRKVFLEYLASDTEHSDGLKMAIVIGSCQVGRPQVRECHDIL